MPTSLRLWLIALLLWPLSAVAQAPSNGSTLLVLGDSLSAAYGIPHQQGWVQLLADRLAKTHPQYAVVNASISGETSAGGRSRLPALLQKHQPGIVIIELGANDGLRGLPIASLRDNLDFMIRESQAIGARVLLVGMEIPPNYGPRYTQQFREAFRELAQQYKTALMPFLLEGVALNDSLMQADRLHPTAEAQPLILGNLYPHLAPLLSQQ